MKNYICINEVKTELTDKQIGELRAALGLKQRRLSEVAGGKTTNIGGFEVIVLEQSGDTAAILCKEAVAKSRFGRNNNFSGSDAERICEEFADKLAAAVGAENIVEHTVDLTADDGLKDYGKIRRRASLLTADRYRRYVEILDKHNPGIWWWLATPFSTKAHGHETAVKCVSPSGCVSSSSYYDYYGVRPFCILKSSIFVSD